MSMPAEQDDRRTAALASWTPSPAFSRDDEGTIHVHSHALARSVLRATETEQAGFGADLLKKFKTPVMRQPVIFLEGQEHQELRRATARFFAPRAVEENYLALMEREADRLVGDLKRNRTGRLDLIAMDMAVSIAGEIAGLTEHRWPGMAGRIAGFLNNAPTSGKMSPALILKMILSQAKLFKFYLADVRPNIVLRRKSPRQDVISHLISIGYKDSEILTECVIFGAAGMITTREFITIAALHLLDRPALRERFLLASEDERRAILEEILRLEPVIGQLARRATAPLDLPDGHRVEAGEKVVVDIRSVNGDAEAVGACPFHLNPDRTLKDPKAGASAMGFGDGRHRCPGAFIAMQESAIFLSRLLALPGLRVDGTPEMRWNSLVGGYEFHECRLAVD
jgi:cytochrome P450